MSIPARCLLCCKVYDLTEEHQEFKKLADKSTNKSEVSFVCDLCKNRVRDEADKKQKPQKPM